MFLIICGTKKNSMGHLQIIGTQMLNDWEKIQKIWIKKRLKGIKSRFYNF